MCRAVVPVVDRTSADAQIPGHHAIQQTIGRQQLTQFITQSLRLVCHALPTADALAIVPCKKVATVGNTATG